MCVQQFVAETWKGQTIESWSLEPIVWESGFPMDLQETQGKAKAALAKVSADIFPKHALYSACERENKEHCKHTNRHGGKNTF